VCNVVPNFSHNASTARSSSAKSSLLGASAGFGFIAFVPSPCSRPAAPGQSDGLAVAVALGLIRTCCGADCKTATSAKQATRERRHDAGLAIRRSIDRHWRSERVPLVREYFYPPLMSALPPLVDNRADSNCVCACRTKFLNFLRC
jgi:hypothetical protein